MKRQAFDKNIEKCDMTSVNLETTLEYIKIQESLCFENLIKYHSCIGIFLQVNRYYTNTQSKTNH